MITNRRQAVWWMLLVVLIWSTSGVAVKESTLGALALNGGRCAVAALVIWAYLRKPHFTWSFPQVAGALCYAGVTTLFVLSTQLTTAANAILLQYTAPLWVALFGALYLKEVPRRADYVTMGLIAVGIVLFFSEKLTADGALGNLLALISGIGLAWNTLFLRKQRDGSPLETLLLGNLIAAAIGLPFLATSTPTALDWGIILFLGAVQLGLTFIIYTWAIKQLQALEIILISTLEPILNPIWVVVISGEMPSRMAMAGGALVVVAVLGRAVWGSIPGAMRFVRPADSVASD